MWHTASLPLVMSKETPTPLMAQASYEMSKKGYHSSTFGAALTSYCQCVHSCSHLLCVAHSRTSVHPIVSILSAHIHHQDVALLDPGCPLRINSSCITIAPRTGPLIAQHSGGWHSYNSAHQNQGGALLHSSSVGVGINDS